MDTTMPILESSDASASEGVAGGSLVFSVSLGFASVGRVTVGYATADGTALVGEDYVGTTGTVTIPAGATRGSIAVPLIDDDEPAETFQLTLFGPVNAVLAGARGGRTTVTGTILDDDLPEVEVSFNVSAHMVREGESALLEVRLNRAPGRAVEVGIETATGRWTRWRWGMRPRWRCRSAWTWERSGRAASCCASGGRGLDLRSSRTDSWCACARMPTPASLF